MSDDRLYETVEEPVVDGGAITIKKKWRVVRPGANGRPADDKRNLENDSFWSRDVTTTMTRNGRKEVETFDDRDGRHIERKFEGESGEERVVEERRSQNDAPPEWNQPRGQPPVTPKRKWLDVYRPDEDGVLRRRSHTEYSYSRDGSVETVTTVYDEEGNELKTDVEVRDQHGNLVESWRVPCGEAGD